MNRAILRHEITNASRPFITADRAAERDAFASLAMTMRRTAHAYRAWAREAESRGDLSGYRHCTKEAERCWSSAKWNLATVQRMADEATAYMEKANAAQDHSRV